MDQCEVTRSCEATSGRGGHTLARPCPRPQACHSLSLREKHRLVQCVVDGAVLLGVAEPHTPGTPCL